MNNFNKEQINAMIVEGKINSAIITFADEYKIPASELAGFIGKINSAQNEFAYKNIEEYEKIVGYEVGFAFRTGWDMARMKMKFFK
jgi:hypothetical protein